MVEKNTRRTPSQDRSRDRVNAILNSTAEIITEKGTGGLKVHELAEHAGVSASSIYQYFPNKSAIIKALNERYVDDTNELIEAHLVGITSLEEGLERLQTMLDYYYDWYKNQPVLSDIWYGMASDKSVHDMDIESSEQASSLIVQSLAPFLPDDKKPILGQYAMLLSHLTGSTIRYCLTLEDNEGQALFDTFKQVIASASATLLAKETS
jgi:AcrR family transcriptional regulator